jgi:hypothetical protein
MMQRVRVGTLKRPNTALVGARISAASGLLHPTGAEHGREEPLSRTLMLGVT